MGYATGEVVHPTAEVLGIDLNSTHVLVGECNGLAAVFHTSMSTSPTRKMPGTVCVETEFGYLYLDPTFKYTVLDY
jgi:hypothetical protein